MRHLYTALSVLSSSVEIGLWFVFSDSLKLLLLSAGSRRLSGDEFHIVGPATEKARRPKMLCQ